RHPDDLTRKVELPRLVRRAAPRRALSPRRREHAALRVHGRRSVDLHEAVDGSPADDEGERAHVRGRLPGGQLRVARHPARSTLSGKTADRAVEEARWDA